jgi:hypothetical protein
MQYKQLIVIFVSISGGLKEKARIPMGFLASEEGDEKKFESLFQLYVLTAEIKVYFSYGLFSIAQQISFNLSA